MLTKKRLEELRARVFADYQEWDVKCSQDGFQEANPTGVMDRDGKDLAALIDAEIARMSAGTTNDEIKEISDLYGDYTRQVVVEIGAKRIQCDYEIATEIARLNLLGINTIASCSGHGKVPASIAVTKECEQAMLDLGYDRYVNDFGATLFRLRQYQKPTDEAVQRALSELGFETSFELQSWWCKHGSLAITALRQMRSEPCWYCKGIESHGIKSVKTVTDESDRELGAYDTPYNFCPNCGRKLVK